MSMPVDDHEKAKARRIQRILYVLTFSMVVLPLLIFWLRHVKS